MAIIITSLVLFIGSCNKENPLRDNTRWERYFNNPVVLPGCIAEEDYTTVSVSDPCVIYDTSAQMFKMWFAVGWFEGDLFRTGIKYAESRSGTIWNIFEGLALSSIDNPDAWDYTSVETPMVVKVYNDSASAEYWMWYSGGNIMTDPLGEDYPRFKIGAAVSSDGVSFSRIEAAISPYSERGLSLIAEDAFPGLPSVKTGVVADPSVVLIDSLFFMWFTAIGLDENDGDVDGGICGAFSADGIHWTPLQNNPLQSLKRSWEDFAAQPSVLYDTEDSIFQMWFNADYPHEIEETGMNGTTGFWHATSKDGISWHVNREKGRDFQYIQKSDREMHGLTVGTCVFQHNDMYIMYFGSLAHKRFSQSFDNPWKYTHAIGLATARK